MKEQAELNPLMEAKGKKTQLGGGKKA